MVMLSLLMSASGGGSLDKSKPVADRPLVVYSSSPPSTGLGSARSFGAFQGWLEGLLAASMVSKADVIVEPIGKRRSTRPVARPTLSGSRLRATFSVTVTAEPIID